MSQTKPYVAKDGNTHPFLPSVKSKTGTDAWQKDRLVRCPCCSAEYETDDHVPMTTAAYDLHSAAPELLAACKGAAVMLNTALKDYDAEPWAQAIRAAIAKAESR